MSPNPPLGVVLHSIGGLMSAIFYLPYRRVKFWAWETYWLVGGIFSWLIVPWVIASLMVPNLLQTLSHAPLKSACWSFIFGMLWGIGGAMFGLTVRYLGIALGTSMALGYCATFGTLLPPIFSGEFVSVIRTGAGLVVMAGVGVCLLGIVISGLAGVAKEKEVSEKDKQASIREFSFKKGLWVATFCGIMSSCMSYGFAAGKPIAALAVSNGASDLWKNLPVLIIVLAGGFTTNLLWCGFLNIRNKTGGNYLRSAVEVPSAEVPAPQVKSVPLLANYALCAVAGTLWYMQFFFYGMGTTKMGRYDFSSWTLHMATIIIFGTLVGVGLSEWKGVSQRTYRLMQLGLVVLVSSTVVIGYGNYLAKERAPATDAPKVAESPPEMKIAALQKLRKKLAANEAVYGLWVTLESASISEMAVALGLDWIVVDAEHGHLDWKEILEHVRATVRSDTVVLVRVAELNAGLIKRALDIGADGVVIPWIETAEQLRQAVAFATYPPEGIRGIGAERATAWGQCFLEHAQEANENVLVVPIVESVTGGRNIHALLQVGGVEIVFIGPADYSSTAGYRGQWEGPGVAKELLAIKDAVRASGKHCGVVTTSHENLLERHSQGFRMLGFGTDSGMFLRSLRAALGVVGRDRPMSLSLAPEKDKLPITPLPGAVESARPETRGRRKASRRER